LLRPPFGLAHLRRVGHPAADAVGQVGGGAHHLGVVEALVEDAVDRDEVGRLGHGGRGGEDGGDGDGGEQTLHVGTPWESRTGAIWTRKGATNKGGRSVARNGGNEKGAGDRSRRPLISVHPEGLRSHAPPVIEATSEAKSGPSTFSTPSPRARRTK